MVLVVPGFGFITLLLDNVRNKTRLPRRPRHNRKSGFKCPVDVDVAQFKGLLERFLPTSTGAPTTSAHVSQNFNALLLCIQLLFLFDLCNCLQNLSSNLGLKSCCREPIPEEASLGLHLLH